LKQEPTSSGFSMLPILAGIVVIFMIAGVFLAT
jgi:hypothetical protein